MYIYFCIYFLNFFMYLLIFCCLFVCVSLMYLLFICLSIYGTYNARKGRSFLSEGLRCSDAFQTLRASAPSTRGPWSLGVSRRVGSLSLPYTGMMRPNAGSGTSCPGGRTVLRDRIPSRWSWGTSPIGSRNSIWIPSRRHFWTPSESSRLVSGSVGGWVNTVGT